MVKSTKYAQFICKFYYWLFINTTATIGCYDRMCFRNLSICRFITEKLFLIEPLTNCIELLRSNVGFVFVDLHERRINKQNKTANSYCTKNGSDYNFRVGQGTNLWCSVRHMPDVDALTNWASSSLYRRRLFCITNRNITNGIWQMCYVISQASIHCSLK